MRLLPSLLGTALVLSASSAFADKPIPYDDSDPVPPGYHIEEKPRTGMAITGGAIAATGVGFFIYGMVERAEEKRQYKALAAAEPGYQGDPTISSGTIMMYMGGIITAVGVPLLVVGLTSKKSVLVRDSVSLAPVVTPSFGGVAFSAAF